MEIIENTIEVKRKAHYYTNDFKGSKPKYVWIAAHGYGQIAERLLRKFDGFDNEEHLVICPEGMSLFYWGGVTGPYAASWMTSKNRLDEIDDFCNYLDNVYHSYQDQMEGAKVIFFGFSQGATTLYRWVHARKRAFDYFINWAGWFPEDIFMREVGSNFEGKHLIVFGLEDQYLTDDRVGQMQEHLRREDFDLDFDTFKGKHEVNREVLHSIFVNKIL